MERAQHHTPTAQRAGKVDLIDFSLLDDSLRLSPWQRLLENERALALVRMLEAARMPADGAAQPNS
jgi:hypothetical protein